ncbi:unnamed protein product [Callosobruchus maculatus]|uniref:Uncharacterized protein n=1 Tax=Callosobruchus maculatus TaxID=64391 RepID=A0A653DM42_CALMS|nr:unnamed protein product [Callosobruchus maculatus]
MQGEEGDKTTDNLEGTIRDRNEEDEQTSRTVIEANSNDIGLHEEIEVIEQGITKSEKVDVKKPKTPIKLPNDLDLSGPSCDKDVVGDDASKMKEQEILCECELPKGTGGAVPMVLSLDLSCQLEQSFEGTNASYATKGDEDSSCLNAELKLVANPTENERIIREINSATTSSLIITPHVRQSTISNDSVLEINCNTSSENSTTISEAQQSGVTNSSFAIEYADSSLNARVSTTNNNAQEDGNLASLESLAKKDSFSSRRDAFGIEYADPSSNVRVSTTNNDVQEDGNLASLESLAKEDSFSSRRNAFAIEYADPSSNVRVSTTNNNVQEDGNLASLESLAKKDSFSSRRDTFGIEYADPSSNVRVSTTDNSVREDGNLASLESLAKKDSFSSRRDTFGIEYVDPSSNVRVSTTDNSVREDGNLASLESLAKKDSFSSRRDTFGIEYADPSSNVRVSTTDNSVREDGNLASLESLAKKDSFSSRRNTFGIEYVDPSSNVRVSTTDNNVQENGNLASLESLAKKDSFSSRRNSQSKASNETVTPTNSRSIASKSVKTDKNIRKTPLPKINPDNSGSKLSRPGTAMASKRDPKAPPNQLGNRSGVIRSTASPKDKLPAIKRTVESPSTNRTHKIAQSSNTVRPYTSSSTYGRYLRKETQGAMVPSARDKMNYRDGECVLKRPSMIPKPRTTSTNVQKGRPSSKIDLERKGKPSDYNLGPKIDSGKHVGYAKEAARRRSAASGSVVIAKDTEDLSKSTQSVSDAPPNGRSINSKITGLQQRVKETTDMLRDRIYTNSRLLSDTLDYEDIIKDDPLQTSEPILPKNASVTLKDLYKNIFEMKETAMRLSDSTTMVSQKEHIEKLLMNITEIQRIADKLMDSENSASKTNEPEVSGSKDTTIKSNKSKDNKIVIKFTQLKDKQKRKEDGETSNQPDEATKSSPGTMTDLETGVIEKVKTENSLKDTDSMDGIFIPSQEPFIHNIEEEEESNGLDITITFPELNHLLSEQNESHLSVRLSDISAEALRKLKRCPKDFTLRMDFVQGKVHFQSGKSPVNNFSIGPDLKFIEYPVDDKMSDIISIKPSTECSYGSQLISVENRDEHGASYKSLKSTDSELFNVVNLPFICRDSTLGTVTRSCMTLRKERMMSLAIIARQVFKSMPQIPSLTYIQEENHLENGFRWAGFQGQEKRRKNRLHQKRGIASSVSSLQ